MFGACLLNRRSHLPLRHHHPLDQQGHYMQRTLSRPNSHLLLPARLPYLLQEYTIEDIFSMPHFCRIFVGELCNIRH